MKKIIPVSILLFFALASGAQEFNGGINAGLGASKLEGGRGSGFSKPCFFGGGWVSYQFTEHSVLVMELDYVQKGSHDPADEDNNYEDYNLLIHYAELPFLYRYLIGERFAAEAGLAYGFYIADSETVFESDKVSGTDFNRHNLSLIVGLYYNLSEKFRINLRSNNSLTPVRPHVSGKTWRFNQGQYIDLIIIGLQYTF